MKMEETNRLKRSDTWNNIYDIIKALPIEKGTSDAPDLASTATKLESLYDTKIKTLPSYWETSEKLETDELLNPIELFINEQSPADNQQNEHFRKTLLDLISFV